MRRSVKLKMAMAIPYRVLQGSVTAFLALSTAPAEPQDVTDDPCVCQYAENNAIQFPPQKVPTSFKGKIEVHIGGKLHRSFPRPCVGVFTEPEHQLIRCVRPDTEGVFTLNVPKGIYRVVSTTPGFQPVNDTVRIVNRPPSAKKILKVVFMMDGYHDAGYTVYERDRKK